MTDTFDHHGAVQLVRPVRGRRCELCAALLIIGADSDEAAWIDAHAARRHAAGDVGDDELVLFGHIPAATTESA